MHASDPVNRVMSEPVLTIGPDDSVKELLRLFIAYPVHHLPVVKERRVVGMLSSADLMKLEFFLPPPGPAREALLNERFRVSKVMRTPVVTVTEHETVQRAAELMAKNGFHSLPVVNGDDHLIGIVTTTDLMNGCLHASGPSATEVKPAQLGDPHLNTVLAKARDVVMNNADPHGIAAALLHMAPRLQALTFVAHETKRYLVAGQDERLHAALQKALDRADQLDPQSSHSSMLGLGGGE
jgi:CBS domain-containing protein